MIGKAREDKKLRNELSEREKWEWTEQQLRERGLPKRGRPKKTL